MNTLQRMADGLKNVLSGRGTSADKRAHGFWHHVKMAEPQIEAAYRSSWLIRKIVDLPADDMTREWRAWELEPGEADKIAEAEMRLGVEDAMLAGLILGRLGGGAVIIGTDGDMSGEPRDGETLKYLKALPRTMIQLGSWDWRIDSPTFGQPENFTLQSSSGVSDTIHAERIIPFHGARVPSLHGAIDELSWWGDSIVEVVDGAVKNVDAATDGFAGLIEEAKVDVFRLADLADVLMQPDGENKIRSRVELTAMGKSNHRSIFLDAADEWEHKQVNWSGMPDLIRAYMNVAAGAADIPATRLYGKAPDGQNATGESDDRNYRSMIRTLQKRVLRPALRKIDRFLLPELGLDPDAAWDFLPLTTLTEKEQAEIDKVQAETANIYDKSGLIPREALAKGVQSKLREAGTYPALGEALDELPDDSALDPPTGGIDPSAFVDPSLGQAKTQPALPNLAATDAAPRSLYVQRKVLNAGDLIAWAKGQGFETTLPADDLHVTIAFSRAKLDWMEVSAAWDQNDEGEMTIPAGGARLVEMLGERATVLLFNSSSLSYRHEEIRRKGATWDHPEYQPHITLTYRKPDGVDLATIEPYRGKIVLGPELFSEVNEEWADEIEEV